MHNKSPSRERSIMIWWGLYCQTRAVRQLGMEHARNERFNAEVEGEAAGAIYRLALDVAGEGY